MNQEQNPVTGKCVPPEGGGNLTRLPAAIERICDEETVTWKEHAIALRVARRVVAHLMGFLQ